MRPAWLACHCGGEDAVETEGTTPADRFEPIPQLRPVLLIHDLLGTQCVDGLAIGEEGSQMSWRGDKPRNPVTVEMRCLLAGLDRRFATLIAVGQHVQDL